MQSTVTLQDLPSAQARFCLGVERFVRRELGLDLAGRTVLVGFSGGVDSTVLLTVLCALAPRLDCRVLAAHLDHGLRPESGDEALQAHKFCEAHGVPYALGREDVGEYAKASNMGIEDAARQARYTFLTRIAQEQGADVMAVGHHLDDLAEDVLMRLTRGSGWPQLGGMCAWDPAKGLLRPLLMTPRADIETFATALGLPWTEDPSNADPRYLRNRMRHAIVPLFLDQNPNFLHQVAALWRMARLDSEDFASQTATLRLGAQENGTLLPAALLDGCTPAQRLRLFKAVLEDLGPGQPLAENLFRLERAWNESRQHGRVIQFPGPKTARVSPRGVSFSRADEAEPEANAPEAG